MNKPTDVRITEARISFDEHLYRAPIKFGGVALDRITILNVECKVATRGGKSARGFPLTILPITTSVSG